MDVDGMKDASHMHKLRGAASGSLPRRMASHCGGKRM